MIAAILLAPLFALQSTGESAVAIKNDNPETWSVEYPRLIQPQVASYRRCLTVANRRIAGKADFESQHSGDLARCAALKAKAIAEANANLVGAKTTMAPEEVEQLFTNIGRIHVARGRDLDQQFTARLAGAAAASDAYEAGRPKGLVIELLDASVVKARTDASAAAAATAAAEKDKDKR
ncbi:hypothetical protein [Porphyrobacter sp. LM 6]|uniref:hypothetical protein n=1 Tax=Porphyrobacter sp. LM 6 TaxID=1896196 RepID=UPI000847918C|nr:hypothetical protein [Porphyrobacter sp. LM 6]AOL93495.1 hypothetical protein BG023_11542 [Porphyrobacter sp. LM 6]